MIVTCPACGARYQFDEGRLDGRSAKITCPSCDHVFVTHPPKVEPSLSADTWPSEAMGQEEAAQVLGPDIKTADFSSVGITWKVRQGLGLTRDFRTLDEFEEALDDGLVAESDDVSYDGTSYQPISTIEDREAFFQDVWDRASRGEIRTEDETHFVIGHDVDDEDADAPTTIVRNTAALLADYDLDDEDLGRAPPPVDAFGGDEDEPGSGQGHASAPLTVSPSPGPASEDPPTEDVGSAPAPGQAVPAPNFMPKEEGGRSRLPLLVLLVIIVGVAAFILYQQGVFGPVAGS